MKKCKHCMSEMDEKAKVCPTCKRRQEFPISIGGLMVLIILIVIGYFIVTSVVKTSKENSEKFKIASDANDFIRSASDRVTLAILYEIYEDIYCFKIDEDGYTGSVQVDTTGEGAYTYKIWLSNGQYYAKGTGALTSDDVIESTRTATTNCGEY